MSSCELWKGESGRHDQHRGAEQVVGVRLGLELELDLGLGLGMGLGLVAGLDLRARPELRLERGWSLGGGKGLGWVLAWQEG